MKILLYCLFACCIKANGQDIPLKNPSFEDKPVQGKAPKSWTTAIGTPDIQPGIFGIALPPSDGNSYVGLHGGPLWPEGIAQAVSMKGGYSYSLSFDLAYTAFYAYAGCYGNIAIYAGDTPGDTAELLWRSGPFSHTNWKRYNAVVNPARDYKYISFWTDAAVACEKSAYGSIVLIDNLSPSLREIPQVIIAVENTCRGKTMGTASAKVIGNAGPYTYLWTPGGQTTNKINNLSPGNYQVTVTAANGTSATASVTVKEIVLVSKVSTTLSGCHGEAKNEIRIVTEGGLPPYRYYLNNAVQPTYTPEFKGLKAGNYFVAVKDDMGCEDKLRDIKITEPDPLQIVGVNTRDISCSETTDGKIELKVTGGTSPYLYKLETSGWQTDNSFSQLGEGSHQFQVKDQYSCLTDGSASIKRNIRECAVFVPTAFTPNGDGQNDLFRAKVHDDVHDYRLDVFTRWGQTVFSTNNPEGAWDGLFKGSALPAATYVWVLLYTDSKQQARKQTGTVMLIR
ncbi:T9SS type B sorting domain-containing protein [Chitinophaga arvensicola]|uniref:T9SS type B sorting domain-containing protein n=1 Tax=Chitinophaga arvensicola TaxID=29529 RepID=UPI0015A534FB|nr:gliding motility-associated C-terminal domain-containing protein [Chitinophaga arvensicola]